MKGTITNCLAELVETKFGKDKWLEVVRHSAIKDTSQLRLSSSDVPDMDAAKLIASTSAVLGMTTKQAADAFGEHWTCVYAPRMYKSFWGRFKTVREMILGMDQVHVELTKSIPNAHPPRFDYKWENDKTLVVTYKSGRGMLSIYAGLVRGLGKHFNERITVDEIASNQVRVRFAA